MAANVVWEASYLPFGGVQASAGPNLNLRFPGQWFQAEAGLHQNWMRDYDPTLGRYLQADPLGLVDGPSIYGYAFQNPGKYTDPRGEESFLTGIGSYYGGLFDCMIGGCRDERVPQALQELYDLIQNDPEAWQCILELLARIDSGQMAAHVNGRVFAGLATGTGLAIATRGKGGKVGTAGRTAAGPAMALAATIGNISGYISDHGNPSPAELTQLFVYGRVISEDSECGCGDW